MVPMSTIGPPSLQVVPAILATQRGREKGIKLASELESNLSCTKKLEYLHCARMDS